jgi:hypothetical protein
LHNENHYRCSLVADMAVQKKVLFLDSILISFFVTRYAPTYSVYHSFYWAVAALYGLQLACLFTWTVIIWPKYFSPLRHLPAAPVSEVVKL